MCDDARRTLSVKLSASRVAGETRSTWCGILLPAIYYATYCCLNLVCASLILQQLVATGVRMAFADV